MNSYVMAQIVDMKVAYGDLPIRHLAVKCPFCGFWFKGSDIFKKEPEFSYQLSNAVCECPKCGSEFRTAYENNIEEDDSAFPEFYKGCLKKKVTWE